MLEQARGIAAAAAALANQNGTGKTSQDEAAGPKVVESGGMVTIKLH